MLKFIHKKHIQQGFHGNKLVIYYSASDIVLGLLLVSLAAFFVYNYLIISFKQAQNIYNAPIGALSGSRYPNAPQYKP